MDKIVLITGGNTGIGKKISEILLENGFTVIINYISNEEEAIKLKETYKSKDKKIEIFKADISKEDDVKNMISFIQEKYKRIDILINNACPRFLPKKLNNLEWEDFQKLIDVQIKGIFLCSKYAFANKVDKSLGKIINIASSVAISTPPKGWTHYNTVKSAVVGLTKSLAVDFSEKNITVNSISPSMIDTNLTNFFPSAYKEVLAAKNPLKRLCTIEDVANLVFLLCKDEISFITGTNIPITGGEVM